MINPDFETLLTEAKDQERHRVLGELWQNLNDVFATPTHQEKLFLAVIEQQIRFLKQPGALDIIDDVEPVWKPSNSIDDIMTCEETHVMGIPCTDNCTGCGYPNNHISYHRYLKEHKLWEQRQELRNKASKG